MQLSGGSTIRRSERGRCHDRESPVPAARLLVLRRHRHLAQQGSLSEVMTAVVVEGTIGKEYRKPAPEEIDSFRSAKSLIEKIYSELPFGEITEPIPQGGSRVGGGSPFTAYLYGLRQWRSIFSDRQLLALAVLLKRTRQSRKVMSECGYPPEWIEAAISYLMYIFNRYNVYSTTLCRWINNLEIVAPTFARFALPILWDYCEARTTSDMTGGYGGAIDWVSKVVSHLEHATQDSHSARIARQSVIEPSITKYDVILTDPPYYDAIPYSDLMEFFYVWLRRALRLRHLRLRFRERTMSKVGP